MGGVEYQVTKVDPTDPRTKGMVYQVHKVSEEIAATLGGKVYRARIINDPTVPTVAGKVYQIVLIDDPDDPSVKGMVYNAILTGGSEAVIIGPALSPLSLPDAVANSLSYVKAFGGTEQRNLPKGYVELEYIEASNESQYITTNIIPDWTTEIDSKFRTGNNKTFTVLSRWTNSPSADTFGVIVSSTSSNIVSYFGRYSDGLYHNDTSLRLNANQDVEYKLGQSSIQVNTYTYSITRQNSGFENVLPLWIFKGNFLGEANNVDPTGSRVYSLKVKTQGVLVFNGVPAKNANGVVGLYDKVSGQFLTNQGTDEFIAGPEIVPTPDAPMDIVSNNGVLKYSRNKANVIADNVVVGKYISVQGVLSDSEYNFTYMPYVPVKPNTTYTLSFSSPLYFASVSEYSSAEDAGFVVRQTKYSTSSSAPFDLTEFTFTTGATTNYIHFGSNMYKSQALTIDDVLALNYMLAESATAIPYEPYVSDNGGIYTDGTVETIKDSLNNIAIAEMLLKVGTYQDVQSILDGVVTRKIGVKVLDGTENIGKSGTYSGSFFVRNVVSDWGTSNNAQVYCSHFSGVTAESSYAQNKCMILNNAFNMWWVSDSTPTLAQFQQWLADQYAAGTPVIVIYPLATATTETVTGQTLQVQAGDNTLEITQASMTGLELEAEYEKEAN